MAKAQLVITDDDIIKIERMAAAGLTMDQIASVWDRNKRTFQLHMKDNQELKDAIDRGRVKANLAVANIAYKMAISGQSPAMTMFWLKCRARWKEVTRVEVDGTLKLEDIISESRDVTAQIEE